MMNESFRFLKLPVFLSLITATCLAPFLDKAFHIDDPLFVWSARQIQEHPVDFFGSTVNWDGQEKSLVHTNLNPPLVSYYLALMALILGWEEVSLHLAMALPALAAVLGTFYLAGLFCRRPFAAAVIGGATPVFLISSTNVMCDTTMLAFYVWAVYYWVRGCREQDTTWLGLSMVFASLAVWTKFSGISLIPLLMAYSVILKQKIPRELIWLLVPVLALLTYELIFYNLYGRTHFIYAVLYSSNNRGAVDYPFLLWLMTGLSFLGGCYTVLFFLSFRLLSPFVLACWICLAVGLSLVIGNSGIEAWPLFPKGPDVFWTTCIQLGLFITAGLGLIVLGILEIRRFRNADSVLLGLWVLGMFVFGTWVNWAINGRSFLPMMPAVAVLLARRLDIPLKNNVPFSSRDWPLIPCLGFSLLIAWSDYRMANNARDMAAWLVREYGRSGTLWFTGHWGFQYYMQARGARSLDLHQSPVGEGDFIIIPALNVLDRNFSVQLKNIHWSKLEKRTAFPWAASMNLHVGAGFYSYSWGPLPFAIGRIPQEKYAIIKIKSS